MAHSVISKGQKKHGMINFTIRFKLFKGLNEGSMNIRTILDDEKIKMDLDRCCNYCGSTENCNVQGKSAFLG